MGKVSVLEDIGKMWPQEMADEAEYKNVPRHLEQLNVEVEFIVSHPAPLNTVEYLSRLGLGINNQVREEYPLITCLEGVRERTAHRRWYFGYFYLDKDSGIISSFSLTRSGALRPVT